MSVGKQNCATAPARDASIGWPQSAGLGGGLGGGRTSHHTNIVTSGAITIRISNTHRQPWGLMRCLRTGGSGGVVSGGRALTGVGVCFSVFEGGASSPVCIVPCCTCCSMSAASFHEVMWFFKNHLYPT
ncbi:MAG TPA: hypothetical protein VF831_01250 [Anaerolineales bacterium]